MSKAFKRLVSEILAVAMVISLIPEPALAEMADELGASPQSDEAAIVVEESDEDATLAEGGDESAEALTEELAAAEEEEAVAEEPAADFGEAEVTEEQVEETAAIVDEPAAAEEEAQVLEEVTEEATEDEATEDEATEETASEESANALDEGETAVAKIGNEEYGTLAKAIAAAQSGDTITLVADIDATSGSLYNNQRIPISQSITIDGAGHTITVAQRGFGVGMNASGNVDVTFRNVTIVNNVSGGRCIDTRGNIGTLTLDGVTLKTTSTSGYLQPLTIGGNQSSTATVNIANSTIQTSDDGSRGYAIITFNPVNMTIANSTIKGWANVYAKGPDGSAGSAGSVFTITGCDLTSNNIYSGASNAFAMFVAEDDNVKFDVSNSAISVTNTGDQEQAIVSTNSTSIQNVEADLGTGNIVTMNGEGTVIALNYADAFITGGTFTGVDAEEVLQYAETGKDLDENGTVINGALAITLSDTEVDYDGNSHEPTVSVAFDGKDINDDPELKLTWDKTGFVNAGEYTVTATYGVATPATATFTINQLSIRNTFSGITAADSTYTGFEQTPTITFKDNKNKVVVVSADEYLLNPPTETNAGTHTIQLEGAEKNYFGTDSFNWTIDPANIADTEVTLSETSYVADGTAKTPAVTVRLGEYTLVEGTDYTVAYSDNTAVGTGKVTITPAGNNFTGDPVEKTFSIKELTAEVAENKTFNGSKQEPTLVVKLDNEELDASKYSVSWDDDSFTNAGTYTATVTYEGVSKTATYSIAKADIATAKNLNIPYASRTFAIENGGPFEPAIRPDAYIGASAAKGYKLVAGVDYDVTYQDNNVVGTATATITPKGNFTGDPVVLEFNIINGVASITTDEGTEYFTTLTSALSAAEDGETVVLLQDVTSNAPSSAAAQLTAQKTVTLDLNGHSIRHTNGKNALYVVGGTGRVPNLTITGTGTIESDAAALRAGANAVVTIGSGVTVIGGAYGIDVNGGNTTLNTTGTISGTTAGIYVAGAGTTYANKIVNINGGSVSGEYGIYSNQTATVNVNDGVITGSTAGIALNGYQAYSANSDYTIKLNVAGGEVKGTGTGAAIAASGNAGDGNYEITISDGKITSDDVAIYHCNDGVLTISGGTITGATAVYQKSGSLNVSGGTLVGNGAKAEYSFNGNGANPTGDALVIDNCGYSGGVPTASVTGGTFTSTNAEAIASYAYGDGNTPAEGFVTGGVFSNQIAEALIGDGLTVTVLDEAAGTYTVGEGTLTLKTSGFFASDKQTGYTNGAALPAFNVLLNGTKLTSEQLAGVTWSSADSAVAAIDAAGVITPGATVGTTTVTATYRGMTATGTIEIKAAVVAVDGVGYGTIRSAFEAVAGTTGKTVTLLDDATLNGVTNRGTVPAGTEVTFDLNGHTLTSSAGGFTVNGGTLSVKNGTINAERTTEFTVNSGTLNIESDAVVNATGTATTIVANGAGTINVEGTVTSQDSFAISGNGSEGKGGYTINVKEGAVVTSTGAPAIYHPNAGTVNIFGGTITGTTAVYQKSGTLNITGGTLHATGAKTAFEHDGNGAIATGDALVVESCDYPGGAPVTNVESGTFTSDYAEAIASYAQDGYTAETGFVYGGIFSNQIDDDLVVEGKVAVEYDATAGTYTVGDGNLAVNPAALTGIAGNKADEALTIKIAGADPTEEQAAEIEWKSSDETIATVAAGVVTFVKAGEATITASYRGKTVECAVTVTAPIAEIDGKFFSSLKDAVRAAEDGDTVKLLADTEESFWVPDVDETITIDLGSNTMTGNLLIDDGPKVTVTNGVIAGTVYVYGGASDVTGYNSFTLASNATIDAGGSHAVILCESYPAGGATNTAYGSTIDINGTVNGIVWVMGNITEGNSVINVKNGAAITGDDVGIALNGNAIVNVFEGASVTGVSATGTGIEARAGQLNVSGGTITGQGTATTVVPSGSGTTTSGAGIAIAQHTTKLPVVVNITGGTITGATAVYESNPQENTAEEVAQVEVKLTDGVFKSTVEGGSAVYTEDENVTIAGGLYSDGGTETSKAVPDDKILVQIPEGEENAGMYRLDEAVTVTFNSGEGSAVEAQKIQKGTKATEPEAPTREGYTFMGWLLGGVSYNFDNDVDTSIELVAKWASNVATIGTKGYPSVAAAVAAAKAGDTIVMTADSVETSYVGITKDITIDLNGKTISRTNGNALLNPMGAKLTVTDTSADKAGKVVASIPVWIETGASFTLDAGTIEGNADGFAAVYSADDSACTIAINGGTVTGNGSYAIHSEGNDTITIANGKVEATADDAFAIALLGSGSKLTVNGGGVIASGANSVAISDNGNSGNSSDITINGGTVSSAEDIAIYKPAAGTLTVNGGTITGATAIYQKSGTLNIPATSTATITGNGAKKENVHSGNGALATGDAIVIESCDYPGGKPSTTVAGGTIESTKAAAVSDLVYGGAAAPAISITGGTFKTSEDPAKTAAEATYPLACYPVEVSEGTYKIQASLESPDIEAVFVNATPERTYTYTGKAITPITDVKVRQGVNQPIKAAAFINAEDLDNGISLMDDVEITYENNENVGTATATITGLDGSIFKGTETTREFEIAGAEITSATAADLVFNGKDQKADVTVTSVMAGTTELVDTDFYTVTVNAAEVKNAGTYELTVTAKDESNYKGSATVEFKVTKGTLEGATVTVAPQAYTGKAVEPEEKDIKVELASGAILDPSEYTARFKNNVGPGENIAIVTVIANANANVTGTAEGKFTITEATARIGDNFYGSLAEAIAAAKAGDTVVLLKDVTENVTVPAGKDITLDLGGKTLTNETGAHTLVVNGKVTVQNGAVVSTNNCGICVQGGELTVEDGATVTAQEMALLLIDAGKATVNGGTFTAKDNAVIGTNGTAGRGGNTLEINGGTFNGAIQTAGYVACGIYVANDDVVTVNGGEFNITNGAGIVARAGSVEVNGGTFATTGDATGKVGDSRVVVPCSALVFDSQAAYPGMGDGSAIAISGGTFVSEAASVSFVGDAHRVDITGGAFSDDSGNKVDVPEGQQLVKGDDDLYRLEDLYYTVTFFDADGTTKLADAQSVKHGDRAAEPADPTREGFIFAGWTLDGEAYDFDTPVKGDITLTAKWGTATAKIGDVLYASLAEAVAAAKDGDTIVMVADEDVPATVVVTKDVTIDFAGHKLTNTADIWVGGNWSTISAQGGSLTLVDSAGEGGIFAKENDCFAVDVQGGAKVTIESGTYMGNISAVYVTEGELTVNGGAFDVQQLDSTKGKAFEINCLDANYKSGAAKVTITGGTFTGWDPSANAAESSAATTDFTPVTLTGAETAEGSGVWTVVPATKVEKPTATSFAYDATEKVGVPEGKGYELSGDPKATKAGDYAATATLEHGYCWSDETGDPVELSWSISKADLTNAVVTPGSEKLTYTGEALTNDPAVVLDGVTVDPSEYDVTYADNTDAGVATITVTAKEGGNYTGTATTQFTIVANDDDITVEGVVDMPYTGKAVEQENLVVKQGEATLAATDYKVTYTNNVEPGTATYVVTLTGNRTGTFVGTFQVTRAEATFTIAPIDDQWYTGSAIEPTVSVTATPADATYEVTFSDNVEAGTATVTVTPTGKYQGEPATATFNIVKGIARVDGVVYTSLQDAIDAVETEGEVELLMDTTENVTVPAGKTIDLDLGNNSITNEDRNHTVTVRGALTVNGTGEIISTNNCGICVAGGELNFESGNITAQEMAILLIDGGTATIDDGTFTAKDNAVIGTNGTAGRGGNTLEINGGKFYGSIQTGGYVACGIYVANDDTVTVNDGEFNIDGGAGIVARAGSVEVNGGTFATTGDATGKVGDSRVVVPCSALVFDSQAAYPGMGDGSKITVSGGTFDSEADSVATVGDASRIAIESGQFSDESGNSAADVKEGYELVYNDDSGWFELSRIFYTVTFDAAGGTEVEEQSVAYNGLVDESSATTTKEGFIFAGWTLDGEAYDFETPVKGDITLVATWTEAAAKIGDALYATLQEAIDAAKAGDTVVLLKDVTENVTVPAGKDITLDLGGKTLTNETRAHTLVVVGKVTVQNGGIVSTNNCGICVQGGELTVEDGATVEAQEMSILLIDAGKATVNGGTFTSKDNAVIGTNGTAGRGGNALTVNGGTFNGQIQTAGYVACGIYVANDDTVTVNGGAFNITNGAGIVARAGSVEVKGGEFTTTGDATGRVGDSRVVVPCSAIVFDAEAAYPGMGDGSAIAVSGGTFVSEAASVSFVGDAHRVDITGGAFSDDSGNEVDVPEGKYLKQDEDKLYRLVDFTVVEVPAGSELTYDGTEQTGVAQAEGYTLEGNKGTNAGDYEATATLAEHFVWSDGTYEPKTIAWKIAKADLTNAVVTPASEKLTYTGKALENAPTVKVDGKVVDPDEYDVTYADNTNVGVATITVTAKEDGNYTGTASAQFTIVANDADITVEPVADQPYTGKAIEPELVVKQGEATLAATDYKVTYTNNVEPGTATYVVALTGNRTGTFVGTFKITAAVARIGETYFTTLDEAMAAAKSGDTVVLLADVNEYAYNRAGTDVTLDLDGHTVTAPDRFSAAYAYGKLTVTDTAGGGRLVSPMGNGVTVTGGELAFEAGSVEAQEAALFVNRAGKATVDGGTFASKDNAVIATNGSNGLGGNEITVNGGTFNGAIQTGGYIACGIYVANDDVVTVNGGTFNVTGGAGIVARAGSVTVNGGEFNTTGTAEGFVGDSKNAVPSSALVFDSKAAYPGMGDDSAITVTGGTFKSEADSVATVGEASRVKIEGGAYSDGSGNTSGETPEGKVLMKDTDGLWRLSEFDIPEVAKAEAAIEDLLSSLKEDGTGASWEQVIKAARTYQVAVAAVEAAADEGLPVDSYEARLDAVKAKLEGIKTLDMSGKDIADQDYYDGTDAGSLAYYKGLEDLNLSDTGVTDFGALAQLTNLKSLDLSENGLGNDCFGPIVALENLESLSLAGNKDLTAIGPLAANKNLATLDVSNTGLTQLQEVATLTSLTELTAKGLDLTTAQPISGLVQLAQANPDMKADLTGSYLHGDADGHAKMVEKAIGDDFGWPTILVARPEVAQTTFAYDGAEHEVVKAGTGYELSGTTKATNADDYTATAKLNEHYAWEDDKSADDFKIDWKITKADMSDLTIEPIDEQDYTGEAIKPAVTVKLADGTVVDPENYDVLYTDNTNPGKATVIVVAKGDNYTGSAIANFTIKAVDLEKAGYQVEAIEDQDYTGSEITPEIVVKSGEKTLTEGTDYEVAFEDNTNPGEAKVTVTGKGGYEGTIEATFIIKQADKSALQKAIDDANAAKVPTSEDGETTEGGEDLERGDQYVSPEVQKALDDAIKAAQDVLDDENATPEEIAEAVKAMNDATEAYEQAKQTAKGSEASEPEVSEDLTYNGKEQEGVKPGTGYTLSGEPKATNAGTHKVTATLEDGYVWPDGTTEPKEIEYTIAPLNASELTVTVDPVDNDYTGEEITPNVTVKLGDEELPVDDYNVFYASNTNPGDAKAFVVGKLPNVTGTQSGDFKINDADKTELKKAIEAAEKLLDETPVSEDGITDENGNPLEPGKPYMTPEAKKALEDAVADAKKTDKDPATQDEADAATEALKKATDDATQIAKTPVEAPKAAELTYNGKEQEAVKPATGYTVEGGKATDAGTHTATATLADGYIWSDGSTEPKTVEFTIAPLTLDGATVTAADQTYDGNAKKPAPKVVLDGKTIPADGYDVTYKDNIEAGTATVTVTGKGNYAGTASGTFKIAKTSIKGAKVTVAAQTYTGKALKPNPTKVTVGGKELTLGVDYKVKSYKDNTNAGTATITIEGVGIYSGTATGTFKINPAKLTEAMVTVAAQTYDGSAKKPAPVVKFSGKTLKAGTDYTVGAYANNVNASKKATVKVTGKGNFTGTVTKAFTINPASIAKAKVSCKWQAFTKKPCKPTTDVKVVVAGRTLKYGTDFTVGSYKDNTMPGYGTFVVTGKGNYKDTVSGEFMVRFKDVPPTHEYFEDVHRAASLGLVSGYSGDKLGYFGPEDSLTRGQVATMLWNLAGHPAPSGKVVNFKDVPDGQYYTTAVQWASSVGVVNGYSGASAGKFGPNDNVTHEQLCVMICNYAKNVGKIKAAGSASAYAKFSDASKVAGWAVPSVGWCFGQKITTGFKGKVNPQGDATRAETASMVYHLYLLLNK